MMTRAQLRRMIVNIVVMLVLSSMVTAMGVYISMNKTKIRKQDYYKQIFSDVIEADSYEELKHDLVASTEGVNHVYLALDAEGKTIGYIADISVKDRDGYELHSYVGVNSDGSTVIGYKRVKDELSPMLIEDVELRNLSSQVMFKQVPVALNMKGYEEAVIYSEYTPPVGLNDGIYYAQSLTKDSKGYIDYVEIEIDGGRIRRVVWDGINIDPTTGSRNKASLTGAYVISGENWATQSYNICHALIELQDVSRLAMKSDGTTEIIEGVTTDISAFVALASECIDNSRAGFDKDAYISKLSSIIESQGTSVEYVTDSNGFIVYPFEDLSPFRKENGSDTDLMTVYETTLTQEELTEEEQDKEKAITATPTPAQTDDIGDEDGLVKDPSDSIISDSVDGIPMSEVRSFIPGLYYDEQKSETFVTTVNTAYKFFREYMNWVV